MSQIPKLFVDRFARSLNRLVSAVELMHNGSDVRTISALIRSIDDELNQFLGDNFKLSEFERSISIYYQSLSDSDRRVFLTITKRTYG